MSNLTDYQNKKKNIALNDDEFRVRENQFKSNNELTQLIESQSYLNEEAINLKHEIEISITKLFEFSDFGIRIC